MSSTVRRLVIEEYENGGFGVMATKGAEFEEMGISNELGVIESVIRFLKYRDGGGEK